MKEIKINICYNIDCVKGMRYYISDESIDLVVTSPPYDNIREYDGYVYDFKATANELKRVLRKTGRIVWIINDQTINKSESGTSFRNALYFKEIGLDLETMIWKKPNFANPETTRYHNVFEFMFILSGPDAVTFNPIKDKKNKYSKIFGKNSVRAKNGEMIEKKKNKIPKYGMRSNVWEINTSGQENPCRTIEHPATFSEQLARDHIISWSNEGDIVLDPFAGSGTTLSEAKKYNRKYIGFEISKKYCTIIENRLRQEYLFNEC